MNKELQKARGKAGMTLEEVADVAGISLRSYQRIEAGERWPRVDEALKIADVLKTTVEELWRIDAANDA
jgi:DNA-binding XRE family transcriptional regulator